MEVRRKPTTYIGSERSTATGSAAPGGRGYADAVRIRTAAAAIAVFLAGLVAACGSSTGSEDSGTTTAVTAVCESTQVTTACRTMDEYQP